METVGNLMKDTLCSERISSIMNMIDITAKYGKSFNYCAKPAFTKWLAIYEAKQKNNKIDLSHLEINKRSIEKLIELNRSMNFSNLEKDELFPIFQSALKLGVQQIIITHLAKRIREKYPSEELDEISPEWIRCINLADPTTIRDYIDSSQKSVIEGKIESNQYWTTLNLSNMKLSSIEGIEDLARQLPEKVRENIKELILVNNRLKELQLEKIFCAFPHVHKINASKNIITKLTASDMNAIKDHMRLDVSKNEIRGVHTSRFIFSKSPLLFHGDYDFSENCLPQSECEKLKSHFKITGWKIFMSNSITAKVIIACSFIIDLVCFCIDRYNSLPLSVSISVFRKPALGLLSMSYLLAYLVGPDHLSINLANQRTDCSTERQQ
jgi:hypothetical protein